jgi:hypothetical protein
MTVERLGYGVGYLMFQIGKNIFKVSLDHLPDFVVRKGMKS